jgi:hypothetical protein
MNFPAIIPATTPTIPIIMDNTTAPMLFCLFLKRLISYSYTLHFS